MKSNTISKQEIVLIGHPFAPIGRGEDIRSAFRSFKELGCSVEIKDVYGYYDVWKEFSENITEELSDFINIFFINGDEVDPILAKIGDLPENAYNIIYPAWELSIYPEEWLDKLEQFDEIWTISMFVFDSIRSKTKNPIVNMTQASYVEFESFIGRQYFGIPESSFVFLFAFDFLSMLHRKNPFAVVESFGLFLKENPNEDVRLVLKLNHSDQKPDDFSALMNATSSLEEHIIIVDKTLSDNEIKNLVRCSDCFVSLHRSEGFGRSLSEAMYLGKPVIATAYSGNMDFMTPSNSFLVDFELIPVNENEYPHYHHQYWAKADTTQASLQMQQVITRRENSRSIGRQASLDMRRNFSYSAIGSSYVSRINEIKKMKS